MRRVWVVLLVLFGIGLLGATVLATAAGIGRPSPALSVVIALLGSIGVPIGLTALGAGWRLWRRPRASELREEAEAKRRAAAALDDAQAAETIKAELEAYVAVRARRLEIDRRRLELTNAAIAVIDLHKELSHAEAQLGLAVTRLDVRTVETLDQIVKPQPAIGSRVLEAVLPVVPGVAAAAAEVGKELQNWIERRRLRRLTRLAPEALGEARASSADDAAGEKTTPNR